MAIETINDRESGKAVRDKINGNFGKSLNLDPTAGLQIGGAAPTPAQAAAVRAGMGVGASVNEQPDYAGPVLIAHRGGSYRAQENTLEAFQNAFANGSRYIEADLCVLSGGAIGCMHDATVDRTTDGTGNTTAFTAVQWAALGVDALTTNAPNHVKRKPAMFCDVLDWAADKDVILVPELKSDVQQALIAELESRQWSKNRIIVQSFGVIADRLASLIAAGYKTMFMSSALTSEEITAAAASGCTHIGTQKTVWTTELVDAAHALNLVCVSYTVNRRRELLQEQAKGVDMVFTDDPVYLQWSTAGKRSLRSLWAGGYWPPGMISATTSEAEHVRRGILTAPNFVMDDQTGTTATLVGHMCPLPDSFALSGTIAFTSGNTWASVFCCSPDDQEYKDGQASAGGYHILFRQSSGNISVYRTTKDSAGATLIGTGTGAGALTVGTDYAWSITVTETDITVTLGATSVVVENAERRGGYFHIGRTAGCATRWGQIVAAA